MPYRLHLPKNRKSGKKYPVILFLHGAGEIGSDNNQHLNNFSQGFSIAGDLLSDAIIICPQTPEWWSVFDYETNAQTGYLALAKRLTDSIVEKYNGDINRIYLTGLSMGSFATWEILESYPNYFAAAVPVCGGAGSYAPQVFIDTPIWIYHGTADPTVSYESSLETYQAIINAGGKNIKFTTLEGVAHNAWDYAYKDRAMFSWLLAQNRKNKAMVDNYKGMLEIVSADGTTVINEKNIENLWGSSSGFEEYIELYFNDEANSFLKQKYKKNKNQTFSLLLLGERIYDFKITEYPKGKMIRIVKTVNDETYNEILRLLENTIRFNAEVNGF
jgi:poly(3-hydroxybutyrate) depolymerase